MKLRRLIFLFLLIPAAALWAADDPMEVLGVMEQPAPAKTLVRIRNVVTGTAVWMQMGETFAGFTISNVAYDTRNLTYTVILLKDGRTTRLSLAKPKIKTTTAPQVAQNLQQQAQGAVGQNFNNGPGGPGGPAADNAGFATASITVATPAPGAPNAPQVQRDAALSASGITSPLPAPPPPAAGTTAPSPSERLTESVVAPAPAPAPAAPPPAQF